MAIDFPNSPTVGQSFTGPNGIIWQWDGVKWIAIPATNPSVGAGNVGRNYIHNPLMAVAQRGTGPWTTNAYTADRWILNLVGDSAQITVVSQSDTGRTQIGDEASVTAIQAVVTGTATVGNYTVFRQPIETVRRLAGKTITVSFYAMSATALQVGASIDQYFGTGGSPSADVNGNGAAVTLTPNVWQRYSVTLAIASATGKTIGTSGGDYTRLNLWLSASSTLAARAGIGVQSGTIYLWGVQLEIGTQATPLEKPDPRYDLANCQRFYRTGYIGARGYVSATGGKIQMTYPFGTTMRSVPSVTLGTPVSSTNMASATLPSINNDCFVLELTSGAGGDIYALWTFTTSADL